MKSLVLFAFVLFFGLSTASAQLFWKQIRAHEEKILRDNEAHLDYRVHGLIYDQEIERLEEIMREKYPDLVWHRPGYRMMLLWGEGIIYCPNFEVVNKVYRREALQRFRDSLQRGGYQIVAKKEGVNYHFRVEREKAFETIDDIVTLEETPHPNKLVARYYLEDLCEENIHAVKPFMHVVKEHSMEEGLLMNSKNALRFPSIDSVAREIKAAERQKALSGTLEDLITYYQYWGGNAHSWNYSRCYTCKEYVHVWNRELEELWHREEKELEDKEVFARIKELLTSSQKLDDRSERIREQLYDAIYRKDTTLLIYSSVVTISRNWLQGEKSPYYIRNLKILDFEGKYDPKHHVRSVDSIILDKRSKAVFFVGFHNLMKNFYDKFLERYPGAYPQWTKQVCDRIRHRAFVSLKELYKGHEHYAVVEGAKLYYWILEQKKYDEQFLSDFENSATPEEREEIEKRRGALPQEAYNTLLKVYNHIDFSITYGYKEFRPEGSLLELATYFRSMDTDFPNFLTSDQKADFEVKANRLSEQGQRDEARYKKEYEAEMRRRREAEEQRRREEREWQQRQQQDEQEREQREKGRKEEREREQEREREREQERELKKRKDCDGCNFLSVKYIESGAIVYLKNGDSEEIYTDGSGKYRSSILEFGYNYSIDEMIKIIVKDCRAQNGCE